MNFEEKEPQWLFEMTFKATNSEANELHLEMLTWPEFTKTTTTRVLRIKEPKEGS